MKNNKADLQKRIQELESENKRLQSDNDFLKVNHLGVMTRQGAVLEERRKSFSGHCVVAIDIDYLHDLNNLHGYSAVDEMMRKAFSLRAEDLLVSFNNASGDEYGFIIEASNPQRFIERLQESLRDNGLSATMAWELIGEEKNNLLIATEKAMNEVRKQKQARGIESR